MPDSTSSLAAQIRRCLDAGDLITSRALVHGWLQAAKDAAPIYEKRPSSLPLVDDLLDVEMLKGLGDVVERTSDPWLLEFFWQIVESRQLRQHIHSVSDFDAVPVLGIPILNRVDLLQRLLDSIDYPIQALALVDNSGSGPASLQRALADLSSRAHPYVQSCVVSRPFANLGVASSWNQILRAFPSSPFVLMVNNDIVFAPGVLANLCSLVRSGVPQFIPLLPGPAAFSAFAITPAAWDRIGLFCEDFYPAYFEDLDFRDRLRENPSVNWIDAPEIHQAMQAHPANQLCSATIASDPVLQRANAQSFQLNRLWYLSRRRLKGSASGQWLRRLLCSWPEPSVP